jgi:DhnA family fructose-bisphosphate aldolase class Ia
MDNLKENILKLNMKGIKLHQAWNSFKIDSKEFSRLIETCREYKLPVFIHLYSKKDALKLSRFAAANQDVIFIVGHLLGLDIFKNRFCEIFVTLLTFCSM